MQIYRVYFSYIFGGACRFQPTCSCYAEEALATLPFPQAAWLILRRIARCHPFQKAQWDPVPLSHAGGPCGTAK